MSEAKKHGIEKLTDWQHSRRRAEMYLGARTPHTENVLLFEDGNPIMKEMTWVPALLTCFREALDNALDEVIGHNHGNSINVTYDEKSLTFSIEDNGRGIPIEFDKTHGKYIATMVLSETKTGRNFGDRANVAGTNGLGISVVNNCSTEFIAEIHRDGKKFIQKFEEDRFHEDLVIFEPEIKNGSSTKTGTKVTFNLSYEVFPHRLLPDIFVKSRVYEIALLNPQVKFTYNGEKIGKTTIDKTFFPSTKPITFTVEEKDFYSKFWIVPSFIETGTAFHSVVNNIPALNGGLHVSAFQKNFFSGMVNALAKEGKKRKLSPNKSDVSETVFVFNHTVMKAPNFDSQSKTRLINEEAGKIVEAALSSDDSLFSSIIKKHPEWIEQIFERCAERTNKKDESEIDRLNKKNKKKKIAKLIEANSSDRQSCSLFITEGDSAAAGASAVRDPKYHAFLPLRGKILNVNGESPKKVLTNAILTDLMTAIGLVLGKKANREDLRYGKVYIAHDMDQDGANIGALVVNFFYTYWPELFEDSKNPFINIFMTPFVIAEKGKDRKYWYADNYNDFKPEDWKGYSITRAKGLGSLMNEDWEHALNTPKTFPIFKDDKLEDTLDLIFNGSRADDRKAWMGDFT